MSYASINSKREHPPPPGKPPGEIFWGGQKPAPGQNFPAKARPSGQGNTYPQGVFWKIWSAFPVDRRRNFGILQKSNLEKNWKAVQVFFGHTL